MDRLDEVTRQRDEAEATVQQLKPLLEQAHAELILLGTHRVLLVGALAIAIARLGGPMPTPQYRSAAGAEADATTVAHAPVGTAP